MSNDGPSSASDLPVSHAHESSDDASAAGAVSGDDSAASGAMRYVDDRLKNTHPDSPFVLPGFDIRKKGSSFWNLVFTLLLERKQPHLAPYKDVLWPIVPRTCVVEGCGRKASGSIFKQKTYDVYGQGVCVGHLCELMVWHKSPLGNPGLFRFYASPCTTCKVKTCIRDENKMPLCIHCTLDAKYGPYEVEEPLHFSDLCVAYARLNTNDTNAPLPSDIPCELKEMNLAQFYKFLDDSTESDDGLLGYVGFALNLKYEKIEWSSTTCSDPGCDCEIDFEAPNTKDKVTERAHGFICFARLPNGEVDRTNAVLYCAKHAAEVAYCGNLKKHPKCMGCDTPNVRFYKDEQCLFCCAKP